MTTGISESVVEDATLEWFQTLGYAVLHGPDIAPEEPGAERGSYQDVVLERRLKDAIAALNPQISAEAREEAFRKVIRAESPPLVGNNRAFHSAARMNPCIVVPAPR